MVATLGWAVVHSLWISTAIAAAAALVLWLTGARGSALRYRMAFAALTIMAIGPVVMAVATFDPMTPTLRSGVTDSLESAVGFGRFVSWRGRVVPLAAAVWAFGVALALVRLAIEWRRLQGVRNSGGVDSREASHRAVRHLTDDLTASMNVNSPVDVMHSAEVVVPMVAGWRRPVIMLPASLTSALTMAQVRGIVAHELAHVARRDYVVNLVQVVIDALLWFHPAARWISRQVRTEREYCCDDRAIAAGVDATTYAHALAALDDSRGGGQLVVAAASGTLLDRIERIAGRPRRLFTPTRAAIVLLLTSVVAAGVYLLALAVPPGVPLDARLRSRSPGPMTAPTDAPGMRR